MACLCLIVIAVLIIAVKIRKKFIEIFTVPPLPNLGNTWWGHGPEIEDSSINPFKVVVSKEVLDDLKYRLQHTRTLTPSLRNIQQQYGFNTKTLKTILDYWANKYNWTSREKVINQFPQFKTNIQGLSIHFVHVKPKVPSGTPVLPLLLMHGWPGSVLEFHKIIPILTKVHEKYGFAFEVIAPSLPGFGFSEGAVKPGLGAAHISVVLKNLMLRLGHQTFYIQGGDWGGIIAKDMATLFPQHIIGLHTNFGVVRGKKSVLKIYLGSFIFSSVKQNAERFTEEERGYSHIQGTKPDTVSVVLNDSPAGIAAYILEKFSTWTNNNYKQREDAGLLEKYTYDELIDNLMFYWIPESFTTTTRIYAETRKEDPLGLNNIPISTDVFCAVARFPYELISFPDWILRDKYTNLVHSSDFEDGGHFAAFELPNLLAEDIFVAVSKMRSLKK